MSACFHSFRNIEISGQITISEKYKFLQETSKFSVKITISGNFLIARNIEISVYITISENINFYKKYRNFQVISQFQEKSIITRNIVIAGHIKMTVHIDICLDIVRRRPPIHRFNTPLGGHSDINRLLITTPLYIASPQFLVFIALQFLEIYIFIFILWIQNIPLINQLMDLLIETWWIIDNWI